MRMDKTNVDMIRELEKNGVLQIDEEGLRLMGIDYVPLETYQKLKDGILSIMASMIFHDNVYNKLKALL